MATGGEPVVSTADASGYFNAEVLDESELEYEYHIRAMEPRSVAQRMRAANLMAFVEKENLVGDDWIEKWRMKPEEFNQEDFTRVVALAKSTLKEIHRHCVINPGANINRALSRLGH